MPRHNPLAAHDAAWTATPHHTEEGPRSNGHSQEVSEFGAISFDDFWAYMPLHNYIYVPTRSTWPAASVNARLPKVSVSSDVELSASSWLDRLKPVEQMAWAPGLPTIIRDRLLFEGGWIERPGSACFNLYLPPNVAPGDPDKAEPWLMHVRLIYPSDAEHIINWLAHRVQHPEDKINHALVLGGLQGIGKDTLLEPVKYAIGPWNFQEASPSQILGRFNGFLKSVILRISEARDLGEFDRFKFYDHMKTYTAAPPDVLRVDEKHLREYPIVNCCGVIITTNHKTDGIFLTADDRRHYVAWSDLTKEDFQNDYWENLWSFYHDGGIRHVAAFLAQRDLSGFNPKAPPPKTEAFWAIADSGRAPEESELADLLDRIGNPPAISLGKLQGKANRGDFADWLNDCKNRRVIPHRLEGCGYAPVRNPDAKDGLWKIRGKRQAVYAKSTMTAQDQIQAARLLG
jgi:uncharacterized protein DUF5906